VRRYAVAVIAAGLAGGDPAGVDYAALKTTIASGGSVTDREKRRLCAGTSAAVGPR
jgi:hypothetical protein